MSTRSTLSLDESTHIYIDCIGPKDSVSLEHLAFEPTFPLLDSYGYPTMTYEEFKYFVETCESALADLVNKGIYAPKERP